MHTAVPSAVSNTGLIGLSIFGGQMIMCLWCFLCHCGLRQHMLTHSFDIQTTLHILDVTAKTAEDESAAVQADRRVV